jgi:hypothetical protein
MLAAQHRQRDPAGSALSERAPSPAHCQIPGQRGADVLQQREAILPTALAAHDQLTSPPVEI